ASRERARGVGGDERRAPALEAGFHLRVGNPLLLYPLAEALLDDVEVGDAVDAHVRRGGGELRNDVARLAAARERPVELDAAPGVRQVGRLQDLVRELDDRVPTELRVDARVRGLAAYRQRRLADAARRQRDLACLRRQARLAG